MTNLAICAFKLWFFFFFFFGVRGGAPTQNLTQSHKLDNVGDFSAKKDGFDWKIRQSQSKPIHAHSTKSRGDNPIWNDTLILWGPTYYSLLTQHNIKKIIIFTPINFHLVYSQHHSYNSNHKEPQELYFKSMV